MKSLKAVILAISLISGTAFASSPILHEKTVELSVDISTAKVKWSKQGYGDTYFVKVLVPALADITLLDHRNAGEAAPCMATYDTERVEDVVRGNPAVETVPFTIRLFKQAYPAEVGHFDPEGAKRICKVVLTEEITATIRGFKFWHSRSHEMPSRNLEDCR